MKKLISILAALTVVTTCSAVGFAADFEIPAELTNKYEKATEGEDAGLYVVDLATVAGDQDQTTILAVKGDTISVGTIEYIGQSADTTFKFDLRNTLAAGETVYVLAGGSDIDAQVVGYMAEEATTPEVENFVISGTVSGYTGSVLPTVVVTDGINNYPVTVNADKTFSIEVPELTEGSYTLTATKTSHLSYTKANIIAETTGINALVNSGDISGDGIANVDDMAAIVIRYNAKPDSENWNANCDLTEDSILNVDDMAAIVIRYNAKPVSE